MGRTLKGLDCSGWINWVDVYKRQMSGSVEAFAEKMNERARKLGATQTHFKNPSGLSDPEHYTTAYDLYLIFNEAIDVYKRQEVIFTTEKEMCWPITSWPTT